MPSAAAGRRRASISLSTRPTAVAIHGEGGGAAPAGQPAGGAAGGDIWTPGGNQSGGKLWKPGDKV